MLPQRSLLARCSPPLRSPPSLAVPSLVPPPGPRDTDRLRNKGEKADKYPSQKFRNMWRSPSGRINKRMKDKLLKAYAERKTRHADHVTRTFQALRMEVNDELRHIRRVFEGGVASRCLEVGGRLVAIAFHPGEDRIVREGMEGMVSTGEFRMVTPEADGLRPTAEEVKVNGRSRSARLRAVERIR